MIALFLGLALAADPDPRSPPELPAWMATVGLVSATGETGPYTLSSPGLDGAFARPPVVAWEVRLPGPPPTSATHTELGGPVIHGDEIFVGAATVDALLVLDRRDGRLLRQLPAAAPVQAAPVIAGGRIYFSDTSGTTFCYPLQGGADQLWSHFSGAPILSPPTVHEGRVYIANVDDLVYALQATDGNLAWRYAHRTDPGRAAELELYGAPSPQPAGGVVLTGFSDGTVLALSADGGEPVWSRRVGEGQYPDIIAAPLVLDGFAILSGYDEPLLAMDLANQAVRWRQDSGSAAGAILADGRLLHAGGDGVLRALDPQTGDALWEWDSGTGGALTQPLATPAGLLVGASGGGVYLVDPKTGAEIWEYDPGYFLSGVTAPLAVEGRQAIALTNAGKLISFVSPAASDAPEGHGQLLFPQPRKRPPSERPPRGPR